MVKSGSKETRNTPKAIEDCHALLGWMLPQLDKFPRARRFTLGGRIEDGLLFVLGYRVWPHRRQLRNDNGHRFARRLKSMARAWRQGRYELADFRPGIASWIGHARHGDTAGLRRAIFKEVRFVRHD